MKLSHRQTQSRESPARKTQQNFGLNKAPQLILTGFPLPTTVRKTLAEGSARRIAGDRRHDGLPVRHGRTAEWKFHGECWW